MAIGKTHLAKIAKYILEGLTDKEACIMSNVDYQDFQTLVDTNMEVKTFLEKNKIKFKHQHLKEIQSKKSSTNSQWILEKLRPDEFGAKSRSNPTTVNIFSQMIKQIQNHGNEQSGLAPKNRGDVLLAEARDAEERIDIDSVLN